jgi:isopentenyl phosphate kinase
LIPVVYGDVIFDNQQKTTIFSGEKTLSHICRYLQKQNYTVSKVIQLSDVDGVLDHNKKLIPQITFDNWKKVKGFITNGKVVDVTGGMTHKVESLLH